MQDVPAENCSIQNCVMGAKEDIMCTKYWLKVELVCNFVDWNLYIIL